MAKAIVITIIMLAGYFAAYLLGREDGIKYVWLLLFPGKSDFMQYLDYRKTGGHDAEQLQKLVNCLRNDYGLVAEWDGLRKFWTIEVDHEG